VYVPDPPVGVTLRVVDWFTSIEALVSVGTGTTRMGPRVKRWLAL
jgi:hypothetical protein